MRTVLRRASALLVLSASLSVPVIASPSSAAGGLEVSIGDAAVAEGGVVGGTAGAVRPLQLTVTLSQAAPGPVSVLATIAPGTATQAADYKLSYGYTTRTVSFQAGQATKTVSINLVADTVAEADETLTVTLSNPTGGAALGRAVGTGTIIDDDTGVGTAALFVGDASIVEGDSGPHKVNVWLTLSSTSALPVTVTIATSNGSATAGSDYTSVSRTITFKAGQVKKALPIKTTTDASDEGDETINVSVSSIVGGTIADGTGVATIIDDDPTL